MKIKLLKFITLCLVALWALPARATVQISGNLQDLGVANISATSTYVQFSLRNFGANIPKISGTSIIVSPDKNFFPDANGAISGTLYGNSEISPAGTFYHVCVWNRNQLFRCSDYNINPPSFNLNSASPITSTPPPALPVLAARSLVFSQATAATTWTIIHNFSDPNVVLDFYDSANKRIFPDSVTLTDLNTVTATFTIAQAGKAVVQSVSNVALQNISNDVVTNPTANQVISGAFTLTLGGDFLPAANASQNLGSSTQRWLAAFDNATAGKWNQQRVLDGAKFTTLAAIQTDCPAGGCTAIIPLGATLDSSAVAITKPIHFVFDAGSFAFNGLSCTTGTEGVRISGSNRGSTSTTQGTILTVASTTLTPINFTNCPGVELDHITIVGPGSGAGKGIVISGGRWKLDHVLVTAFGGDGGTIDGTTVNSNVGVCIGSRFSNNLGNGFKLLGTNANVNTFVGCEAAGNTLDGFNVGTSGNKFIGTNTSANASGIGYHFVSGGSNNFFEAFSDAPNAPETAAIQFDAGANSNEVRCDSANMPINTDNGSGNRYYGCGGTFGFGGATWNVVNSDSFRGRAANPATSGILRLGTSETTCWRNNANSADLCMSKNASDQFLMPGTLLGPSLITPTIGGETVSAAPRAEQITFLPGALTSTWAGTTWTLDKAITVTRFQVQVKTAPAGCTTNAVVRLSDGTTNRDVTVTAAANDSGAITQNYAAAAVMTVAVQTAAAGCTTSPADANAVVQYRMQ